VDQQNPIPQQNDTVKIPANGSKTTILVAASILLAVVLTGGAVFVWQQYEGNKTRDIFNKQLDAINSSNQNLVKQLEILKESAQKAESEAEDIAKKTCKGVWKNVVCVKATCVDSDVNEKPQDIYIKGNVVFTNEDGVDTTVYDECTGSKQQVNEMWCYESPSGSGNYVQGRMVYNCPKGCLDGACTK
jgi:hypothetical protein